MKPHQLCHFFCSNALEKGFTVAEVANIAGHSNIHTTLRYTNPSHTKMIEKVNSL
ncbi:site-specific integrase [Desulfosporosinus fructosivorans]|uniref:site-specific integrase n=1 Tax=Desulfosporosinus fructosivorans TaxID=2018669 RepID=UPI003B8493B2